MHDRKDRIRALASANQIRTVADSLLRSISEVLSVEVVPNQILSAIESEAVLTIYKESYQAALLPTSTSYRECFAITREREVFRLATRLAARIGGEPGILLMRYGGVSVALKLPIGPLLAEVREIIDLDGDSLGLLSDDLKSGLLIDRNTGDQDCAYEVAVWGERWSLLAFLDCAEG